ncbi:ABC transporter permease [Geotalea toluenoxydans]|uniref:ABC transporter permease n=1 Tax=Geotalea toluenoxydans TaxID=421624 RepID=UPI0006D166F3|nr:ABC transporter permease [Geotalea toluenoxydans]
MKEMINELIHYRELLYILTWRDIKIRYKQSVMGFMWAVFMPMLIVAAGIIMKLAFSFISGKPFNAMDLASISVKALPWSFFIGSIRFSTICLTANSNLVSKIYFPREIFPLAAILANLFDFAIAASALAVILAISNIGISLNILWLPVLLFLLVLLTAGIAFVLSCANLFFRDVKYIVEVILTFAIFFTPVFYEASLFGKWSSLLLINPVGSILEAINNVVVLHQPPDLFWLGYAATFSLCLFVVSWFVFHRSEFLFAERI